MTVAGTRWRQRREVERKCGGGGEEEGEEVSVGRKRGAVMNRNEGSRDWG